MADSGVIPEVPKPLVRIKDAAEWCTWAIGALSFVAGIIESSGGIVGFLTQVALFGFACYIAAVPVVGITLVIFKALDSSMRRQTNNNVIIWFLIIAVLAGGYAVRNFLFYDGIGAPGDLDAMGSVFMAAVGAAVLLAPLVFLWHRHGSKPA